MSNVNVEVNCCRCHGAVALNGNHKTIEIFDRVESKDKSFAICDECYELYAKENITAYIDHGLNAVITRPANITIFGGDEIVSVHPIEEINLHLSCIGYHYCIYNESIKSGNNDDVVNYKELLDDIADLTLKLKVHKKDLTTNLYNHINDCIERCSHMITVATEKVHGKYIEPCMICGEDITNKDASVMLGGGFAHITCYLKAESKRSKDTKREVRCACCGKNPNLFES